MALPVMHASDYDCTYTSERGLTVHDLVHEEALRRSGTLTRHSSREHSPCRGPGHHHQQYECCSGRESYVQIVKRETDPAVVREIVRRNNRKVDIVNRTIGPRAVFSQVHPKMKPDGAYPKDFSLPKTVDDFDVIENRILVSYNLLCTFSQTSREKSRETVRQRKLWRLYEFLGADHLTPNDPHYGGKNEGRYVTW